MREVSETVLRDNFLVSGNDYAAFKTEISDMDAITKEITVRGRDITFYSLCNIKEYQREGRISVYVLSDEYVSAFLINGSKIPVGTLQMEKVSPQLLDELRNTTGLMAVINDELYLVSDIAIKTLTTRAAMSGEIAINRQNIIRDLHLADAIFTRNSPIHFVYREYTVGEKADGTPLVMKKIFAAMGGAFTMMQQQVIADAVDLIADEKTLGEMSVYQWSVDHKFTDVYVDFPEAAKDFQTMYKLRNNIIPGLFLCTSDTGYSSVIARGVYRIGGSYVITDEVAVKHAGNIKAEDIMKKVESEIFTNIRKLPETLATLIGIEVIDYSEVDLTTTNGAEANYQAVRECIEKTARKVFKDSQHSLPVKRQKALIECMCDEINTSIHYTLYDIAINFLSIPDRVEGIENLAEIRKACAKAPYLLCKKPKEELVTLLPA